MSRLNKFGAKRTRCRAGHTHDSGRESRRCDDLHLMLLSGEIEALRQQPQYWFYIDGRQVKHPNGRRVGFKADFAFFDVQAGASVVEDSKGVRTEAYVLRLAIFRALFPDLIFREV